MATPLFRPSILHLRTPLLFAGLGVSAALFPPNILQQFRRSHIYSADSLSSPASVKDWSLNQYSSDAKTPIVKKEGGLNGKAVRQLSLGSILGLVAGLGVSVFSKPLVILIGLAIVGVQTAQSYGIKLVTYNTLQKYVKGVDLRSAVQDNVALKISFGMMFALSAFAEF
nr:hypothetical protein B0A51_11314 [Rachicladosporium sp. CCFEE 5018]